MRGFRHELVRLDQGELGQPPEVGLEAPDALLRVEHRVVVALGTLQLDRQAVGHHLVAGRPGVHPGAGAQDDSGEVGADYVVRQVVAFAERGDPAVALQEAERRERFEDRRPHGVVVDRGGHDRDQRLARAELGSGDLVDVQGTSGVLLLGGESGEDVDVRLADHRRPVALGYAKVRELLPGGVTGKNRLSNFLHDRPPMRHV